MTKYARNSTSNWRRNSRPEVCIYDEAGHLLGEYNSAGTLIQETIWFDDIPVAVLKPNGGGVTPYYIHTDHLNTPRRISRPSDNAIVWRWDSDPFGTTQANENPSGLGVFAFNLRFPGQYYDAESGLHYNYFRDYDSATGRYVQSDPIGIRGGLNTYEYALSDPLANIDEDGLVPGPRPGYFRRVNCFGPWMQQCRQKCASRGGVKSCMVTKGALGMPPKIYIVPTSLSCVCNDDDVCKKNPAACIIGAVVATIGVCAAPEITIPALLLGGAAAR